MIKRRFILSLVLLLGLILVACGGSTEGSDGESENDDKETLVIADWGTNLTKVRKETIIEPFEEEYDINVVIETPVNYGKLKAMVESGNVTWDVVNVDTFWGHLAGEQGLLEALDYNVISEDGIIPELIGEYSVGAEMFSTAIAYSTNEFSEEDHPTTWAEFWDVEKYPGPRGLYKSPLQTFEAALLADGVSPDELHPIDVDRAFDSLDKLKEKTEIVWWEDGAQPPELISNGSVTAVSSWNGRVTEAIDQGAQIGLEYNEGIMASVSWVVPKGSKNKELAMKFIDYATNAQPQADFVDAIDYLPINEDALDQLSEERRETLGQTSELITQQVMQDEEYWAENYDEIYQHFQEWLLD